MDVNATIREIDGIKNEVLGSHEEYQSRRKAYKKTLKEVKRTCGSDASADLADWIKTRIREQRKLPKGRRVRQQGADICRERGHTITTNDWLGA